MEEKTEVMPIHYAPVEPPRRNRLGIAIALAISAGPMILIMLIAMINGEPVIALVSLFFAVAGGGFSYAEAKEHANES